MKTLYVHIGTPKTATTAIQNFCYENQEILEKYGYAYPIFPYIYPEIGQPRNGHFLVGVYYEADGSKNHVREKEIFREGLDHIRQLFQEKDAVILSDELIWRATFKRRKSLWRELEEEAREVGYQVKILVYLRRQDQYVSSWWNQTVKMGRTPKESIRWEDYLRQIPEWMQLDYDQKLNSIAQVFGEEHVIVRRFQKSSFVGQTIYEDFLDGVGLKLTEEYTIPGAQVNDGLKGNFHEIKRVLNTLTLDWNSNLFFRQVLSDCGNAYPEIYTGDLFSQEEAVGFLKQYEEGNRKIAAQYLKESKEPLFHMPKENGEKWDPQNPYQQEDLIRFTGMALMELRKEMRTSLKDQKEQQEKSIRNIKDTIRQSLRHPLQAVGYYVRRKTK